MSIGPREIIDITARNAGKVPSHRRDGNQFIVVHYLGADGQNPDLYCQAPGDCGYGGHYNIFWDGTIYKAADPNSDTVWHCGGGRQGYDPGSGSFFGICTNYNSIGIECSVHNDGTWYFTTETQESLVFLVSKLMDDYGIPINHVIRHWDVTGKHCPAPYVENTGYRTNWTWDQFKQKLKNYRSGKGDEDEMVTESFKKAHIKKLYATSKVRTVTGLKSGDLLSVRTGPSSDTPKNPAWPQLANGNQVREYARYDNNWANIVVDAGPGKGTTGYVNAKYLK